MGFGDFFNPVKAVKQTFNFVEDKTTDVVKTAEKVVTSPSQFSSAIQNVTARALGNNPITDVTRTLTRTAQDVTVRTVRDGVLDRISDVGEDIIESGSGFLGGVRDFLGGARDRIVDAGRSLFDGAVAQVVGFGRSVVEGAGQIFSGVGRVLNPSPIINLFQGDISGAWNAFTNNVTQGFSDIGRGLIKGTVQAVFDAGIVGLSSAVSAVQTLVGLEPPSRGLTTQETDQLRSVYGDTIDYSQIRIKEGSLGLNQLLAPHTIGNTIYIPQGWLDPNSSNYQTQRNDLLVHETAHVWQYQNGGTDYIGESLWNQAMGAISGGDRNAAYDFEQPIKDGKTWSQLNPEQQAHLIESAYSQGLFDNPNARFVYNGNDYTDYVRDAMRQMRAGEGAP